MIFARVLHFEEKKWPRRVDLAHIAPFVLDLQSTPQLHYAIRICTLRRRRAIIKYVEANQEQYEAL